MGVDEEREAFHRQLEYWQLRAARMQLARSGAEPSEIDDQIDELANELARPEGRSERMRALAVRLGLPDADVELLWWIVACAIEPAVARGIEPVRGRRGPTLTGFAELARLDAEVARDLAIRLACGHPLLATGLVRSGDDDVGAHAVLTPSPRLLAYLLGDDRPEAGIDRTEVLDAERGRYLFDIDQLRVVAQLAELTAPTSRVVVALEGPARTGRRAAIAYAARRPALALDAERVGTQGIAAGLRALRRELALADAVPVLANVALDRGGDRSAVEALGAISRFVDEADGPVVLTSALPTPNLQTSRPIVRLAWSVPEVEVRRALWLQALDGRDLGDELDQIAMRYRLGPGGIARAVASARAAQPMHAGSLASKDLVHGVRHNIAEGMAGLATHVEVTQTWDDAVLSDDTRDQVHVLIARLRHQHLVLERWGYRAKLARGTGVAALFSGPPGTGKTMCAGLIARELDLELYQVDLSQVVSKWVGETEKQLARVFDSAEAGHALLLFDEADALFGQRSSETRGAVDRYANLEVNFLLQRIESFGGITILTTNLDTAIDKALKRRLAGHIVFAAPDEDERTDLWRRLTRTSTAPLAPDLDYEELAHVFSAMTGANIRNAAIAAAFYAARDGATTIEQEHLMRAGRAEYRSMGHVLADRSRPEGRSVK